jgi:hypothetical protein
MQASVGGCLPPYTVPSRHEPTAGCQKSSKTVSRQQLQLQTSLSCWGRPGSRCRQPEVQVQVQAAMLACMLPWPRVASTQHSEPRLTPSWSPSRISASSSKSGCLVLHLVSCASLGVNHQALMIKRSLIKKLLDVVVKIGRHQWHGASKNY